MRKSIATVSLSGPLSEKLTAIATAGFDGVEIFENDLLGSPLSPEEVRRRCADLDLSIDLYQPFRDFEAVPADALARSLRRAELKFAVMERLGADLLLVCSSVAPESVDDDALAAEQLRLLADRAAAHGIRIAYEALAWGRHVSTYDHAWRIVEQADHPALGTCLDSFHILSRGSDPKGIEDIPGEKIFFLQLADAPLMALDVLQWSRHYRCFPGQGGFTQPWHQFDEAALFHRGVLGLEADDSLDLADPYGLVRSRAVASPDGGVRLILNIAPAPGAEDTRLQHIALATDDIVGAARRVRERGAGLLPIPTNYYDDLDARCELEPQHLATLAELGILYDRDENGEFFHCYTATVGRVFFELVQRTGGYQGYGAQNAAVRLAAQRLHRHGV